MSILESATVRELQDDELTKFTLADVVIPLPSGTMQLPKNEGDDNDYYFS
jgi:hypothetical protein